MPCMAHLPIIDFILRNDFQLRIYYRRPPTAKGQYAWIANVRD